MCAPTSLDSSSRSDRPSGGQQSSSSQSSAYQPVDDTTHASTGPWCGSAASRQCSTAARARAAATPATRSGASE